MAEDFNTALENNFLEESWEFKNTLEKHISLDWTEVDEKYDKWLALLAETIWKNEFLTPQEKQQLFDQVKLTLESHLSNLKLTFFNEQMSAENDLQMAHFEQAVQLLGEINQALAASLTDASDRDASNWFKKGITDEEFAGVFKGQMDLFYKKPENQTLWSLEQAQNSWWEIRESVAPVQYVEINTSENLRDPQTHEAIRSAQQWERFQLVGDLPPRGKYEYRMVIDENGDVFKLCINDWDNVSQKTFEFNKQEKASWEEWNNELGTQEYIVINISENLRDPQTHEVIWTAQQGEEFQVVRDLPSRWKYAYKLVENSAGEQFKLCINDGNNVSVMQNEVSQNETDLFNLWIDALVADWLIEPSGELTAKVNSLQIHEVVNSDENQTIWLQIPKDVSMRQNLPQGVYLKASVVRHTYVYDDFPEYWQVRVKEWLQLSLNQPPESSLYTEQMEEPIPLDRSEFPTNPAELAETAERCPVKILYTESRGIAGHPWGHTALEINGKVYSYGRWGKTDDLTMGTTGEGALFVFDSFQNYNRAEWGDVKKVPIFGVDASQREKIEDYFLGKIKKGSTIDWHRLAQQERGEEETKKTNYAGASEYIIDDYNVFDQNCTTITLSALENAGWALKDVVDDINLESRAFETLHDAKAVLWGIRNTLADLNISFSRRIIEGFKSYVETGKINPEILPADKDGTILSTGTAYDGKNLMDVFYAHLSEEYGTENIRLPRNLYQALQSPDSKIASLNLQNDLQLAYAQGENKKEKVI